MPMFNASVTQVVALIRSELDERNGPTAKPLMEKKTAVKAGPKDTWPNAIFFTELIMSVPGSMRDMRPYQP